MIGRIAIIALALAGAAVAVERRDAPGSISIEITPADETYSAGRWLLDFQQAQDVLAARAPNLEWSVEQRGLDLPKLVSDTEAAIRNAPNDEGAREALRTFVTKFGDGHISIQWPDEKPPSTLQWGTASVCRSLGYEKEDRPAGLAFDRVGARPVVTEESPYFPIYTLDAGAGRKLGILRISSFYEWGYYEFCPQAVVEIGLPPDGECSVECGAAIGQRAAELLTAAMARQIQRLKDEGVSAIAVDITQNGGGSLWLDPVARMLSAKHLKAPRLAFTRTDGWRDVFTANLSYVEADLATEGITESERAVLTRAKEVYEQALKAVDEPCDRSGLWRGETPACSVTVNGLFYATGVLNYAPPGEFANLQSASALFYSTLYPYQEGIWNGPLYILVDEGSASASEHFATLLHDNKAAVLVGEPTYGAGCGWMGQGDQPVILAKTGADLHVPDCIWVDSTGRNEVEGLEPDVLVPWRFYDNAYQKARRTVDVLRGLDASQWPMRKPAAPGVSSTGRNGKDPAQP